MNKKQAAKLVPGMALCGVMGVLGAYASSGMAQEVQTESVVSQEAQDQYLSVNVTFDADNCPIIADPELLEITLGKKVVWKAYDSNNPPNPIKKRDYYSVHFDPFKGRELASDNDGEIKSRPIDQNAPATDEGVYYKYTILGLACTRDAPYDPRFKVRR